MRMFVVVGGGLIQNRISVDPFEKEREKTDTIKTFYDPSGF